MPAEGSWLSQRRRLQLLGVLLLLLRQRLQLVQLLRRLALSLLRRLLHVGVLLAALLLLVLCRRLQGLQ